MAKGTKPSCKPPSEEWHHQQGYPKMADALMAPYPSAAIFRRFGFLTTLQIMSLQSELIVIERKLRKIINEDDSSKDPSRDGLSANFVKLRASGTPALQKATLEESTEKLKEYHDLILRASQVAALPKPDKHDLATLREWLDSERGGDGFLQDSERLDTWYPGQDQDLIALAAEDVDPDQENFVKWINPTLAKWFHKLGGGRWKTSKVTKAGDTRGIVDYTNLKFLKAFDHIAVLFATMLASLLPAIALVVLHFIPRTIVRIYATVGMTAGLGLLLRYITRANMKEVFGATAAFVAVEVVYIGSANGTGSAYGT